MTPVATDSLPPRNWSSRILVRYLGVYLLYLSTVVRLLAHYDGKAEQGLVALLLAVYGALLAGEPFLTRRAGWRPWAYLLAQSAVVVGLQFVPPRWEPVSTLFVPLSLQAVLLLDRRAGFWWIAAFTLAIADPVTAEWDRGPIGVAMVALYGGLYFLVGHLAYLIRTAEAAQRENRRLIADLRLTHRQLQDYASQKERFAAAQERTRLARELHDSATQTIFSMNLTVQTARMLFDRDRPRVAEQLDRLQELAAGAVSEINLLLNRLRLEPLASEGLPGALRRLAAERKLRDGLHVRVEITGHRELPEPVVAGLCRIAQEALNNVAKHAGTTEAVVRLELGGEKASLEVVDHGVGFAPEGLSGGGEHLGLGVMAERARELGWKLTCDSRPGRGTRLRAEEM